MLTLKKVKELVGAPSHTKRTPSPKMLYEEGIVLLRREFDQGSHLTVYNSGYVLFSAGKRNTVFHIHDCCGDYAYDAAEGKGDVIEEEYFENCEWHIEMLQLLLRLGTFQLSDIFYNTVGGVLGGLMYCVVIKARKRL